MRSKKWFATVLVLVACSIIIVSVAIGTDVFRNVGEYIQSLDKDTVVASVNGVPIYKSEFESKKGLRTLIAEENQKQLQSLDISDQEKQAIASQVKVPSDEALLQEMILKVVRLQEAERLGLKPTDAEIDAYFDTLNKNISQADPEQVDTIMANIDSFREGLGLTQEEYDTLHREAVADAIVLQKLSEYYFENSEDKSESSYQDYLNSLMKDAEIVIE